MTTSQRLAVVDLGSNSFRLEIGRQVDTGFKRTAYFKETVRLGGGLDDKGMLTPQAMQTGWDCLARFGRELVGFAAHEVRAVATQTLRDALNRDLFLAHGEAQLGFPIEVISGDMEARLIYQGVVAGLPPSSERQLVIDIGGRSTEIIIGQSQQIVWLQSFPIGSVAWSLQHFADGVFTASAFMQAEEAAKKVLRAPLQNFIDRQWHTAYGAAGTVNAVADVLEKTGWDAVHIDRHALDWLYTQLLLAGRMQHLVLPGLRDDRKPVIAGGLSLLRALMDLLGIQQLTHAKGGLRHGLLQSMARVLGRPPTIDSSANPLPLVCHDESVVRQHGSIN
jgi:exopolyphosphatase/guanosine-5'-triphosphate,3'-diphosphate pyrophosphatase